MPANTGLTAAVGGAEEAESLNQVQIAHVQPPERLQLRFWKQSNKFL